MSDFKAQYPRVTQVISTILLPEDYFKHSDPKKGTYIHLAVHLYNNSKLDYTSLDRRLVPYINQYKEFLSKTDAIEVIDSEVELEDKVYQYQGHVDMLAEINGKPYVIDIKTGEPDDWHDIQLAAYFWLVRNNYTRWQKKATEITSAILYLWPTNYLLSEIPFTRIIECYDLFKAALSCYKYRQNKGGKNGESGENQDYSG